MEAARSEKVSLAHHKIYTEILIDASPDVVWSVLTDTGSYGDWAAFLVDIKGEIRDGTQITTVFQVDPAKEKLTTIDHRITVVDGETFFWAEKGPGGIRDNHHFRVEPAAEGKTRFIQSDEIMGGITWLMGGRLAKMYEDGYQAFNRGLKAEAERRARAK
ncbi:MAG: SRPBCC family protein [Ruegeria sp.]|uniref:SRPBCC family protein n=1 Tax=Ruegeria sp. TaxID=1879320 RepID=UPI00349EE2F9